MANRVYVYSANRMPKKGDSIRELQAKRIVEFIDTIPPAVICLIGAKPITTGKSILFKLEGIPINNIVSDFEKGCALFEEVFTVLAKLNTSVGPKFDKAMTCLKENPGKFFICETGELSGINDLIAFKNDLNKHNKELYKFIKKEAKIYKSLIGNTNKLCKQMLRSMSENIVGNLGLNFCDMWYYR